jgi:hypothetical protein
MDNAKDLFQAHGVSIDKLHTACGSPNEGDSCEGLALRAANFPRWVIFLHIGGGLDVVVMLIPLPPVKTAGFVANLYFLNGLLNSISVGYDVVTTSVKYARGRVCTIPYGQNGSMKKEAR